VRAWRAVATSSAAEGRLNSELGNDDRDGATSSLRDRERPAAPGSSARSAPHRLGLMAPAEGAVDAHTRQTGEKWKPLPGRAQSAAGWRTPRSPPSGEAAPAGVERPPPCRIAPPLRSPVAGRVGQPASPPAGAAPSQSELRAKGYLYRPLVELMAGRATVETTAAAAPCCAEWRPMCAR